MRCHAGDTPWDEEVLRVLRDDSVVQLLESTRRRGEPAVEFCTTLALTNIRDAVVPVPFDSWFTQSCDMKGLLDPVRLRSDVPSVQACAMRASLAPACWYYEVQLDSVTDFVVGWTWLARRLLDSGGHVGSVEAFSVGVGYVLCRLRHYSRAVFTALTRNLLRIYGGYQERPSNTLPRPAFQGSFEGAPEDRHPRSGNRHCQWTALSFPQRSGEWGDHRAMRRVCMSAQ